jgi:D,D-heptose 1,7-bisphosphate phosphatase
MNGKAVFLEKDGTLIENIPHNVNPDLIKLTDGALGGLGLLHNAGYMLVVITNQSGVAHGKFREEDLAPVQEKITRMLADAGIPLAGFYYCPHHPSGKLETYSTACFCRKPNPGMLFRAGRDHNLNLAESWMVGDMLDDMEVGRRTEGRTILIDNGNETEWRLTSNRRPHFTAPNLLQAAQIILEEQDRPRARVVSHGVIRALIHTTHSRV